MNVSTKAGTVPVRVVRHWIGRAAQLLRDYAAHLGRDPSHKEERETAKAFALELKKAAKRKRPSEVFELRIKRSHALWYGGLFLSGRGVTFPPFAHACIAAARHGSGGRKPLTIAELKDQVELCENRKEDQKYDPRWHRRLKAALRDATERNSLKPPFDVLDNESLRKEFIPLARLK